MEEPTNVDVKSIVSIFDGKPGVKLTIGDRVEIMRPNKAREIGLTLLEVAVEAERDAATVDFVRGPMKGGDEDAAKFLTAIRDHRQKYEGVE